MDFQTKVILLTLFLGGNFIYGFIIQVERNRLWRRTIEKLIGPEHAYGHAILLKKIGNSGISIRPRSNSGP